MKGVTPRKMQVMRWPVVGVMALGQIVQPQQQMESAFSSDSPGPGVKEFRAVEATLHAKLEQHCQCGD
jgi:hypothetical protein